MTQVLYRAKRKDNGEWIEGYYAKFTTKRAWGLEEYHVIFPSNTDNWPAYEQYPEYEKIIPETLCRLLEEPDYNGDRFEQRFFQNDIIAVYRWKCSDPDNEKPESTALVIDEHSISTDGLGRWFPQDTTTVRVIGNAYDNPELLKGHDMRRFVCHLHECPDNYTEQHRKLTDKYGIHGAHAGCYICNFENDYICHQFNGGCDRIDVCRRIREEENHDRLI